MTAASEVANITLSTTSSASSIRPALAFSPPAGPSQSRSRCSVSSEPRSPSALGPFSPGHGSGTDTDDAMSLASSASAMAKGKFEIQRTWRPCIMACINQPDGYQQNTALTPTLRNEIVRDLVVHMYSFTPKIQKAFCTKAAEMLVTKYPFMRDVGKVSGYVSLFTCNVVQLVLNCDISVLSPTAYDECLSALSPPLPSHIYTHHTSLPLHTGILGKENL